MGCPGLHCPSCASGAAVPPLVFAYLYGFVWVTRHLIEIGIVSAACAALAVAAAMQHQTVDRSGPTPSGPPRARCWSPAWTRCLRRGLLPSFPACSRPRSGRPRFTCTSMACPTPSRSTSSGKR